MDIIPRTGKVFLQSEKYIDTHTLMGFHHIVKHIVCRIEKSNGTDGKGRYEEISRQTSGKSTPQKHDYHDNAQRNLHINDIKRYHIFGEKQKQRRDTHTI